MGARPLSRGRILIFVDQTRNSIDGTDPCDLCRPLFIGPDQCERELRLMAYTMRTTLLGLASFVPLFLSAQLRHGPVLGPSIATVTAGQFLSWSGLPKLGVAAGYRLSFPWTSHVRIDGELMYMNKGSWVRNAQLDQNTFTTLSYLELPVLLNLDLDTIPDGLFLKGGVVYGYWLSGSIRTTQQGQELANYSFDLSGPNVRRSQWSVALALGKQGAKWAWEVRGQSSVTPFDSVIRSQNLVFSILLSYRFPLPTKKKVPGEEDNSNE